MWVTIVRVSDPTASRHVGRQRARVHHHRQRAGGKGLIGFRRRRQRRSDLRSRHHVRLEDTRVRTRALPPARRSSGASRATSRRMVTTTATGLPIRGLPRFAGGRLLLPGVRERCPQPRIDVGRLGALPVQGDYDGDGRTDPATYGPASGLWSIRLSTTGYTTNTQIQVQWGLPGDVPVPGDYDGDGRNDPAVYRPARTGAWYVLRSSTGYTTSITFTSAARTDQPVAGDFDGDGRTDPADVTPSTGTWRWLRSSAGYAASTPVQWARREMYRCRPTMTATVGSDLAVYRRSTRDMVRSCCRRRTTRSSFAQSGVEADACRCPSSPRQDCRWTRRG